MNKLYLQTVKKDNHIHQYRLIKNSELLTAIDYDPHAKAVFAPDPNNADLLYYFNRDRSGNLYCSQIDLSLQGFSSNPSTPWGEVIPSFANLPISSSGAIGRHLVVGGNLDEKLIYVFFTRYDGNGTWIERIRLDINGPDLDHPEKVGYFDGYDPKGNGEIQLSPDGKWLGIYVGKDRQGWFDARDAEIMAIKMGGDFLPSIKREVNDDGSLGESMQAIHQMIDYGNSCKGSLDFAEKGQHVFYGQHTLAMRNNSQSVLSNHTLFQRLLTANSLPFIVSEDKVGDIRRTNPFTSGNNTMNILATGDGGTSNLYTWNYLGYYSNDIAGVSSLTASSISPKGFLPTQPHFISIINSTTAETYYRDAGKKQYELKDHLGNVRVTLSDVKTGFTFGTWPVNLTSLNNPVVSVQSLSNYYPGGMLQPGRSFSSNGYRFGFNGQEKVDEVSGGGNHNTARFWEYDTRLSRRWNLDPVEIPSHSLYLTFSCNPIWRIDPLGDSDYKVDKKGIITLEKKTKDKTDKLFATDKDGSVLNETTVSVNKGVLDSKRTNSVTGSDNKSYKFDQYDVKGDETAKGLFEFLATNTDVEWSQTKVGGKEGAEGKNILTTSHVTNADIGGGYLLSRGYTFRGHTHSHPYGKNPSKSDKEFANDVNSNFPKAKLEIFHKGSYFQYNQTGLLMNVPRIKLPAMEDK